MENEASAKNTIRYDDSTIEHEAAHMPDELRDDYRWLKAFVREECSRDIHRLTERFGKVGVYHDATTWSKILRGQWNRDRNGVPLPSPVIAADRLSAAVAILRADVHAAALRGRVPFIDTTTTQSIMDYIDALCVSDRINKFGVVVGYTGSQKTASFREFERRRNHGRTRWIEAPENGAMGEFITLLGVAFGYSKQSSASKIRANLMDTVRPHHCLIVDNCQDLYREKDRRQPAFSYLRRLQDVTGCTVVLSITTEFHGILTSSMAKGYFEQFEGRSGGRHKWLILPEYPPDDDVLAIAKGFGLEDARKHLKELVKISREPGRVRRLFEDLQEARIIANSQKTRLTIDHVREARDWDNV